MEEEQILQEQKLVHRVLQPVKTLHKTVGTPFILKASDIFIAGMTMVAVLAWKDFLTAVLDKITPFKIRGSEKISVNLFYAIVMTLIVATAIILLIFLRDRIDTVVMYVLNQIAGRF